MGGFVFFGVIGLVVALVIAWSWYNEQQKKPVDVSISDVPSVVLNEIKLRIKGFQIKKVMKRPLGPQFRMNGQVDGRPLNVKIRLKSENSQQFIDKIEIQPETRSSFRSLKGKHRVELSTVPDIVMKRAYRSAETYGAPLEHISRVKAANVQGQNAFDIKGWSGDWRVEVELLANGELLELELQYRPKTMKKN